MYIRRMLRHALGRAAEAAVIERAVKSELRDGLRTSYNALPDGSGDTAEEMGDAVVRKLSTHLHT